MISAIFGDSNVNFVLLLLLLLPAVQWVTGALRAFSNHTFDLEYLDVFIRTDLAGRVLPLLILIVTGRVIDITAPDSLNIPGLDLSALTGGGIAAAVVYLVVVVKRIVDNVNPSTSDTKPAE